VYVRELDGLEARLIPGTELTDTGYGNMNPFFSPDGQRIGFFSPGRGIMSASLDGTSPLKMVDEPSLNFVGASWGSNDTLIFSAGRALERASAHGGGKPQLLTPERTDALITNPVMLPGGRAVLFSISADGERVAALDLTTGEQKTLIEGGQGATYAASGHIVYLRGTTLTAAPFDAMQLAVTGEPVALFKVRRPNNTAADYSLSTTGTLVYVPDDSEVEGHAAVVWVDRAGSTVGRAVSGLVDRPRDPALSPDGARLALAIGPQSDADIWIYDLGGRPPIPLALPLDTRSPVWSPDSKRVAFSVLNGRRANIYTLASDGSQLAPAPLGAAAIDGFPRAWSAADELFIFRQGIQVGDIDVIRTTVPGDVREVVATEFAEFDPALSPNGRWLAYTSTRTGRYEVWAQGYPDGVPVRISTNGGFEPRWSADGRELFYLQGTAMMSVAVETERKFSFAQPVQLFDGHGQYLADASPSVSSYDVAHDGRFLMIQTAAGGASASSIVVVQNWTEELKQRVPHR